WHRGTYTQTHEQRVSLAVRHSLAFLLSAFRPAPHAPTLLATTVPGELHEFGALLAASRAAEAGWRAIYLGPGVPPVELGRLATANEARIVGVSAVQDEGPDVLEGHLRALRDALPPEVRLIAGGGATDRHAERILRVE